MNEAVIECVPNFSEGRDSSVVSAILEAMHVAGVSLLDWSLDRDHNRSVVTIAGSPSAVIEAAVCGAGKAAELIDLTAQRGVHPRIGAADVIPFVPVSGVTLEQCAIFARQAGMQIWNRYNVPVYFMKQRLRALTRAMLEDVRRGQFEGLRDLVRRDPARRPDIGDSELHPTAGASAVGARKFLIAYNLYLDRPDMTAARAIAKAIRASNGGLAGVKAMGVLAQGRAQISLNITDFRLAPMGQVYAALNRLAEHHGAKVADAELIGLLPEQAYEQDSEWVRLLIGFNPEEKILERRMKKPLDWPFMDSTRD